MALYTFFGRGYIVYGIIPSMETSVDIKRERELLAQLGLPSVKHWPARCTWYAADGSLVGRLGCDPYSRLLYLERGMRPSSDFLVWDKSDRTKKPESRNQGI